MGDKPMLIQLKRFADDRGVLDQVFNSDLPFAPKRIYTLFSEKGIIRGFHGHRTEWKAFYVPKGSCKFLIIKMDETDVKYDVFVLNEKKAEILVVPPNYYNGFIALQDCTIISLSSLILEDSLKDDIRINPFAYGKDVWGVEFR